MSSVARRVARLVALWVARTWLVTWLVMWLFGWLARGSRWLQIDNGTFAQVNLQPWSSSGARGSLSRRGHVARDGSLQYPKILHITRDAAQARRAEYVRS